MKNILILFLGLIIITSCSKENGNIEAISQQESIEKLIQLHDSNATLEKLSNSVVNPNFFITEKMQEVHIIDESYLAIQTDSENGLVEINAITYQSEVLDGDYEVLSSVISENGLNASFTTSLTQTGDNLYRMKALNELSFTQDFGNQNSVQLRGGWWECMTGVLDIPAVQILGVAGGVGCVGCGIAAGVIVGFGAIGCAAA